MPGDCYFLFCSFVAFICGTEKKANETLCGKITTIF